MQPIRILFSSISGNTRSFVKKLTDYAHEEHIINSAAPLIEGFEISDLTNFTDETDPFFVCVPTYLSGGNGIDNGVKELMTNTLGEYITYHNNAQLVQGIIGSGNRNFNEQYILTARRYAHATKTAVVADYELRGTNQDVERIYNILITLTK
ncbi:class Ib ribonucleoside-diphosphate reductase assembly flavoprotein NrdI [Periweissella fabalis]|uniref:Class Ib ribonucleoside-diphosphate reductase assembly flavoprotein NrdI n=1 Tax=Periweissella fabalis TaxID=1070421 RepID=A0A7X6N420_9LACO|nr:class Ib ribonucleoside-diphosphate reductase assembly flavoprotein NrdI [Periweissella fabalis]MCM0599695.1 class Ib ribonucleoside-diphosphate reductase assembly flavoprotein NrdI [Periweissella fabalis]NKZ24892.1 class Ib ribonucleoside-diphosphate reductase assembly flavoprotein NrdI [Periweissella fabalis]